MIGMKACGIACRSDIYEYVILCLPVIAGVGKKRNQLCENWKIVDFWGDTDTHVRQQSNKINANDESGKKYQPCNFNLQKYFNCVNL